MATEEALSDSAGYGWVDWLRQRFGDMHKERLHYTTLYGLQGGTAWW